MSKYIILILGVIAFVVDKIYGTAVIGEYILALPLSVLPIVGGNAPPGVITPQNWNPDNLLSDMKDSTGLLFRERLGLNQDQQRAQAELAKLSREQQQNFFDQNYGLQQDRFGFEQRQYNEGIANRNKINKGLMEQIEDYRSRLGQPIMSQDEQNRYISNQLDARKPQQRRDSYLMAKTLGFQNPATHRAIAGNMINDESNVRADFADRLLQMDSQRNTEYQGLIAKLFSSQRG